MNGFLILEKNKENKRYDIPKRVALKVKLIENDNKEVDEKCLTDKEIYYLEHNYE